MNRGLQGVFKSVPAFGVPLLFLWAIRRLRLAVHVALPSLLRIGCRHPASREENEDLILDQRGIRSTHYVPGESWFGDECAHCLFREWRYSSHRIQSAGLLLSLELCKKLVILTTDATKGGGLQVSRPPEEGCGESQRSLLWTLRVREPATKGMSIHANSRCYRPLGFMRLLQVSPQDL
jgi:hypothetical protein